MSSYQIAFHLTQQGGNTPLTTTLTVNGDNTFLAGGTLSQQVTPYMTQTTPALVSLTITGSSFHVLAANPTSPSQVQSLQFITYVSAQGSSLSIYLDMPGSVAAGYSFLGASGTGSLNPGANTIPFPSV